MAIAKFDNIDIENVSAQRTERELIGDTTRTAGGKMVRTSMGTKRIWSLECNYLTLAEANAIYDHLDSIDWGVVDFWLDEFGATSNTVEVFVEPDENERVVFYRNGVLHADGRNLSFRIFEI